MSTFKDYFSDAAVDYAKYRPRYPEELFQTIANNVNGHNLVWDCATGNGQAALGLSAHFDSVIATDASANQIENAFAAPNVEYRLAKAEESGLANCSVDAVAVGQALHWFDLDCFYAEANRVLKPGGLLAVWAYGKSSVDDDVDTTIRNLNTQVLHQYWAPEVRYVEEEYRSLSFPFDEIAIPFGLFKMFSVWDLGEYVGYLKTWSAIQKCLKIEGTQRIEPFFEELAERWGEVNRKRTMITKLFVRMGHKRRSQAPLSGSQI